MRLLNKMMLAVFFAWSSYAMAIDSVEISNKINECNQIVNKNNDVSWIVHQYDRFSHELKQQISVKYNFIL